MAKRKKLGEILVGWGLLSPNAMADAIQYCQANERRLGEALVELELCSEEDVTKALAAQFDMEYVDLDKSVIVPGSLALVPQKLIRDLTILPMCQENGRLKVIIPDPMDLETLDLLRFRLNTEIEPVLAPRSKIVRYIETFLSEVASDLDETMRSIDASIDEDAPEEVREAKEEYRDDDAPIIRLINLIISEAVRSRASDIHIEPMVDRVRARYRIDGVCVERDTIPKNMQGAVITRLKIMAGMDIAEKRLPQDGRITQSVAGQDIDFRVSSAPHYHGESVVLRILRPDSVRIGIQALGFEEEDYQRFMRIIKRPNGIFLVTGPTGSGKTTTLYAALQELNRPDRKIITAEEPVEYCFAGMNQCEVREEIGLTFERILRAMLRQAPNIILVGEIRDLAVGEIAIAAALTGHLVFSTLHTNDAPSAITRLIDMGIKPFLVASSIQAIMAQRLVRVICSECKQEDPNPDKYLMQILGLTPEGLKQGPICRGVGCSHCNHTGFRGRLGIFEMMAMNSEIREMAFNRAPTNQIRKAARAAGMRSLMEDGKIKVLRGTTTPEEVVRITQAETALVADE